MSDHRTLSFDFINSRFKYDPDVGILWRLYRDGSWKECKLINTNNPKGAGAASTQIVWPYYASSTHIIFMLMTKRWPAPGMVIDHSDMNVHNNKWNNLREITLKQSVEWRGVNGKKRIAFGEAKGVYPLRGKKYVVKLNENGKQKHIGVYDTLEEANIVATRERLRIQGEFAGPDPNAAYEVQDEDNTNS